MANYRRNRINEEVQRELCEILREVKDPRVCRALVNVTAADVSADLKYAKVFYSTLGKCEEEEVQEGLVSAQGFIRTQIARRLNLRVTPKFTFIKDRSAENGARISSLLKQVEKDLRDNADGADSTESSDGVRRVPTLDSAKEENCPDSAEDCSDDSPNKNP